MMTGNNSATISCRLFSSYIASVNVFQLRYWFFRVEQFISFIDDDKERNKLILLHDEAIKNVESVSRKQLHYGKLTRPEIGFKYLGNIILGLLPIDLVEIVWSYHDVDFETVIKRLKNF